MTSYKQGLVLVPPPTLEKRLEALQAARTVLAQEYEWRRKEIAALRRDVEEFIPLVREMRCQWGEFVLLAQQEQRRRDPRLRSHVIRDDSDRSSAAKAAADDPKHPGWPAGTPDGRGGKYRPKDDGEGTAAAIPAAYAPNPYFPPVPPGYDPKTWKQGTWPNNNLYLRDPEGNTYTAHPEDAGHWRHWDKQDGDGNDQGRWPPNSLKLREGQKRLRDDQSTSDPNGDAPPWTPDPLVPVIPIPMPLPPIPAPVPIEPIPIPEMIPIPG